MSPAQMRRKLVLQLEHIITELEATKPVAQRLSDQELESRFGGPSVKELYGLMAAWDSGVVLPFLKRMQDEHDPSHAPDEPSLAHWNEHPIQDILEAAQGARQELIDFVAALPETKWKRTGVLSGQTHDVYGLLHALTQHDVNLLLQIARQLQRSF